MAYWSHVGFQARTKRLGRRAGAEEARGSFQKMFLYRMERSGVGNLLRGEESEQLVADAGARLPLGEPRERPELCCTRAPRSVHFHLLNMATREGSGEEERATGEETVSNILNVRTKRVKAIILGGLEGAPHDDLHGHFLVEGLGLGLHVIENLPERVERVGESLRSVSSLVRLPDHNWQDRADVACWRNDYHYNARVRELSLCPPPPLSSPSRARSRSLKVFGDRACVTRGQGGYRACVEANHLLRASVLE